MTTELQDYYNRYSPDKKWSRVLLREGRGIQAAELNEIQEIDANRARRLGDSLYTEGHIVSGCEPSIDIEGGIANMGAGRIYLSGEVRDISAATLRIPADGTAEIGVRLVSKILTEHEDGTLRHPGQGCPDYMKPGGARRIEWAEWGLNTDITATGIFYPVYTVSDMVVVNISKTTSYADDYMKHLARYDREAHGMYIIEGLRVTALSASGGEQHYSIGSGKAHVQGYEVSLSYAMRLVIPEEPDIMESEAEPHMFEAGENGVMRLDVNHGPIDEIIKVGVTIEETVTITHGSYTGCLDNLAHTSIVQIVRIRQGATTYERDADYRLTADKVDWSPAGNEPAPGSKYEITYQYRTTAIPEDGDAYGFTIGSAVPGSLVLVDYTYRLPRKDLIVLSRDGGVSLVKGVAHRYAPVAPETPSGTLRLALVDQTWVGLPKVKNDAVKAIHMSTIETMQKSIVDLYDLVALERLKTDALVSAPSAVHGVFVDPFLDDDLRDVGIAQTAAIVGGALMLPISGNMADFPEAKEQLSLDYTREVILEQDWKTGSMKINPYQAFEPMPVLVSLDPSVDRWNYLDLEQKWTSDVTRSFTQGAGSASRTTVSSAVELADVIVEEDVHMRVRDVRLRASGMGKNEKFYVLFDSVPAESTSTQADENGDVDTIFTVPDNVLSGERLVEIIGTGSTGRAIYTGLGTISINVYRNVTTRITTFFTPSPPRVDPLAQTFTLSAGRHVLGVDVYFVVRGMSTVRVQIRETLTGMPTQTILAEGEINADDIRENASNHVPFPFPVFLEAGVEYAIVVMTDTSDHELAIAELGEWDEEKGQWVKGQTYQTGVLLSSSNASTWTAHQNADLWFRLIGAHFTSTSKRVTLGNVVMEDVTEIMPLADIFRPVSGSDATFIIMKSGEEIARVQASQVLSLSERINGEYRLDVELTGSATVSPILFSGTQLLLGSLADKADYFTRAFSCGGSKKVSVRIETLTPSSSKTLVYVQTGSGEYTEANLDGFDEIGDGWRRMDYSLPCDRAETRVKVTLSGTPAERPFVRNLRAVILDA